jgi:hypothetical protein
VRWLVALLLALALAVVTALWLLRPGHDAVAAPDLAQAAPAQVSAAELRSPREPEPLTRAEVASVEPPAESFEEEDLPPEAEGPWPPDPVQLGPAMLDLRLRDARSGEPIGSFVHLWRIDAPGNEGWTEGDQLQTEAQVPEEGWLFTRLPEGRYRLVCDAASWDSEPPEITVSAPRTTLDVSIDVPTRFRVRVVVRDRYGALVPSVTVTQEQSDRLSLSEPWRFERQLRSGDMSWSDFDGQADAPFRPNLEPQPEDGFDLGLYGGATRGAPKVSVLTLETPDRARVRVRVPARADGDLRMVAVAVPLADVASRVLIPGGAPAQADVEVWGEAIEFDPALPLGGGWDHAPVRIRAGLAGYEPVDELWTVALGELPWIELVPAR